MRYPGFKQEVERRAKLDLFDYKEIAQPLPKCYYEINTDNNCFGIGYSLRQYAGVKKEFCNAMVEHGYFFGTYVQEQEKITFAKRILTFGDVRKMHIEAVVKDKEVCQIGPYIHYAPDYYDESRLTKEKKRIGRTLLVFFSHSGTGESVSFDLDALIEKINSIRKDFQTVVISLFWSDINSEIEKRLKDEGYLIFSSGHRYDYYFLSRQKTMIKLADVTMSNSTGTHLAYCSYLNKPHWIVRQEIKTKALNKKGEGNMTISDMMSKDVVNQQENDELYLAFAKYSDLLTDEQRKVCDKYFGLSYVRTKEEILNMVE
ncbi:MAG: hypothetical protein PHW83_11735 [Bacteroidales bacterium]|nr:hypothetical protein [Bacteroidales bacterium]